MNTDWQPFDPKEIKIDVSQLSTLENRLAIEVPAPIVNKVLATNRKQGERAFGDEVLHGMLLKFCMESWTTKIDWRPLWQAVPVDGSAEPVLQVDHPFRFEIDVDHHPEIIWPEFRSLEIIRPVRVISDDLVAAEVREQCLVLGTSENLVSQFEVGDLIRAEIEMRGPKGQALAEAFKTEFMVPESGKQLNLAGLVFDDIFAALEERVVGDEISLVTTATSQFADTALVDQEIRVKLRIVGGIRRRPIAIEEVLEQYGTPNELIFKQQVRIALQAAADRGQSEIVAEQFLKSLLDQVKDQLRIPDRVIPHFKNAVIMRKRKELKAAGWTAEQIEQEFDSRREVIDVMALGHAHRHALINLLTSHLDAKVDEKDLEDWVAVTASKQGRRPEEVRAELNHPETLKAIVSTLMVSKITKTLLKKDRIVLTDMDADEWNRLKNSGDRQENGE